MTTKLCKFLSLSASLAWGQLPEGFKRTDLITGLDAVSSTVAPDGRVFAVEKFGKVHVVKNGAKLAAPLLNWESNTNSALEKGMMALALHPQFAQNGYIYIQYTDKRVGKNGQDRVSRFTVNGDVADPASEKLMISLGDAGPNYHHGGGLAIGPDDMLYINSGGRGGGGDDNIDVSQDVNRVEGKILRIGLDGVIPEDNPWYKDNDGDAKAVWASGMRNPFTLSFKPGTDTLYFTDVRNLVSQDRVSQGKKGTEYGYDGGASGLTPLWSFSDLPDAGAGDAMIGSLFYQPPVQQFPAEYKGKYFFGNVAHGNLRIRTYDRGKSGAARFGLFAKLNNGECPIDFDTDMAGSLYVTTRCQTEGERWTSGKVVKITFGDPAAIGPRLESELKAAGKMNWRGRADGGLTVELRQDGPQTVELRGLDGRIVAMKALAGKGSVELAAVSSGLHLLIWSAGIPGEPGRDRAVAKVLLR